MRPLALLLVVCALTIVLQPALTAPLVLETRGFRATWDLEATGQLTALEARDWRGWYAFAGDAIGDLQLDDGQQVFSLANGRAAGAPEVTQQGDLTVIRLTAVPQTPEGAESPWRVDQVFTCYPEGAVFCDFTLRLPDDAPPAVVREVSLVTSVDSGPLPRFRWFWKRDWRGDLYLPREAAMDEAGYLRVMGASFARGSIGYTNHWEVFLEKRLAFGGAAPEAMHAYSPSESDGRKLFAWTLYRGEPLTLPPGYTYNNRWGVCVAGVRQSDLGIGQRIAHWQEGNANLMTYPSDSAIEAMAAAGVSVCVLHLYWKTGDWGRDFRPYDPADMARWVRSCHRRGIKCVLYTIPIDKPGMDGINAESYGPLGVDGLYFDFGSVHFRGDRPGDAMAYYEGRDFPAMDFLNLTRHYRRVTGADGLMIAHAGGAAPDALYCLKLNAYLPGEAGEQGGLLATDLDEAWYHSGLAYAVCHPWCEYEPFQTRKAVANFAAIGSFPHVLFGRGTHQDNNYHRSVLVSARFALPYWQMLRCLPMDGRTTMYNDLTGVAARADLPGVHCVVYRQDADLALLVVANTGLPGQAQVTLDPAVLKLGEGLNLWRLAGDDIASLRIEDLGPWHGGPIPTTVMDSGSYEGYLLAGPRQLRAVTGKLTAVRELVAMYGDQTPPTPVTGLTARTELGAVNLSWQAADAPRSHVTEYRVYRQIGTERELLASAEETTAYADYTAPPGRRVTYEVTAVTVAGVEGPSQRVSVRTAQTEALAESLSVTAPLQPHSGTWAVTDGWYRQASSRQPATADGLTHHFPPRSARFLRVLFTGGYENFGAAHVVELQVRDADGNPIQPVKAITSGSDPGHPESDIMDGVTDRDRNGWWSDRNMRFPVWVGLDFGVPVRLAETWVLTFWDGTRYYNYSVEVSEDGQEWQPVASIRDAEPLARAFTNVQFSDGVVAVTTLESATSRSGGGLLFRCPDANNGYALYLDNGWDGNLVLAKLVDGKLTTLKAAFFPYSIFRPIPHLLKVEARGPRLTCYCDQVKVFEVEDATFAGGTVGLFSQTSGPLAFRNLLIAGD
ncbi:MAG: hypothetical protein HPY69_14365 [Armatimonadetes bacterium]|nr:hypothetical protein [Armatimonadota bacterium]